MPRPGSTVHRPKRGRRCFTTTRVRFAFVAPEHRRRQVRHFNEIVEAFVDRDAPGYVIRDQDGAYGDDVRLRIASPGI